MDWNNIIFAILCLGALGAIFGFCLAYASKIFYVEIDERVEGIVGVLPGANCGGCGFAGCSAYATAIVETGAPITSCAPGGGTVSAQIAAIMGVEAQSVVRTVAAVKCSGGVNASKKFDYLGINDCVAANRIDNGQLACPNGCLGFGTCVNVCAFGALSIVDGVAVVNHELCTGCMKCSTVCPKQLFQPVPYSAEVRVACATQERGPAVRKFCTVGCIGCTICQKTCQFDAVHVENNLSAIDYTKCTNCGECAAKCPRKIIKDANPDRQMPAGTVA